MSSGSGCVPDWSLAAWGEATITWSNLPWLGVPKPSSPETCVDLSRMELRFPTLMLLTPGAFLREIRP